MAKRTDNVSTDKRSKIMSAVRSTGNKATEMVLIHLMRKYGITGWRRHVRLHGKPDFVFSKQRAVIFVDSCFWHGCKKHCRMPKGNRDYWLMKIAGNQGRDLAVNRELRKNGWRVFRIWEHDLVRKEQERLLRRIQRALD